ncbi:MAG: PKD domain-containing protein [Bacteroidota bacterium]|nr:PKD domain-containing protein [Bacteroidota bacterium]
MLKDNGLCCITGRFLLPVLFCILLTPRDSYSQLCQGSLGDPIVDIDFGSGTSVHGGALPSGQTSYTYSTDDFPMDGSYTIENSTAGSGSIWWSTTDHTGNSGGYMMVVNASISLTDYFYKNTITGLCPGTVYEFAAWVLNLLKSQDNSPPNITFMIEKTDGTLLNSYTTGSIPLQSSAVWKQYGFYFSTPENVSTVVVVMRNNSAGGAPANDIALDDITFRPCGPDIFAKVTESSDQTDTICKGTEDTLHFEASVSAGYNYPHFQWQEVINGTWQNMPGDTLLSISVLLDNLPSGTYSFRLAAGEMANFPYQKCRVESNVISIIIVNVPDAKYGVVTPTVCANEPIEFIDSTVSISMLNYEWNFGDGGTSTLQNPSHIYSQSGTYNTRLIVSTPMGCKDTASLPINVTLVPVPHADFTISPTDTSIFHPTVTFSDKSTGGATCSIDWGDGTINDCLVTQHDYSSAGTYTVREIVGNSAGCSDTASSTVIIRAEFRFFVPTAFTPDGDGLNDVFRPVLYGVYQYTMLIFNRFGEQIFITHDSSDGWDGNFKGTSCPEGTYAYRISFYDEVEKRFRVYSGSFVLLRN